MLADELTRRCRRRARVFQRPHGEREQRIVTTSSTGRRAAINSRSGVDSASAGRSELFDGYLEVAYGGSGGRLGARVELWASDGQRFRSCECCMVIWLLYKVKTHALWMLQCDQWRGVL